MTVRIATWNVWWRFGDHRARAPGIAAELARVAADVVCLQEVWGEGGDRGLAFDDDTPPPGGEDPPTMVDGPGADGRFQAAELADALDLQEWRYAWRRHHDGQAFGNAILSRHPVVRAEALHLPPAGHLDEQRTCLLVEVDAPAGRVVGATTHLNFLWDHSHVRQVQVDAVCRWLADRRTHDAPVVLTGDLNAEPISDEVRKLTGRAAAPALGLGFHDAWEAAGDGDGATWSRANTHTPHPPFEGDKRIDYVLCSWPLPKGRGIPLRAERIGTIPDPDAGHPSDHFGVAIDLAVSPRES